MDNLDKEYILIHQELIRREAGIYQAMRQSAIASPSLVDRLSANLGDVLIRAGPRLKNNSYTRPTTEGASAPSFLIML